MSSLKIPRKVLKIQRGQELKVHISDDLYREESFMNQAYRQALRAVAGIVQRSSGTHGNNHFDCITDEELLSFGSNVIAFSAQRGCGKTSTMLSFSQLLEGMNENTLQDENHQFLSAEDRSSLEKVRFHVLSPISPSVLEERQNILYVVLARLYSYAQELLDGMPYNRRKCSSESTYNDDDLKQLKFELQACFDGINGIKQETKDMPRDFLELRDICDGLSLCKHFSKLIQTIIKHLGKGDHYLILQMDDADSQVKNGFGVLEDVRKYLQVPNLIVLISADMELMHESVLQDFLACFPDHRYTDEFEKRLTRMCQKYIDKLIPPSHLICLPQLDAKVDQYANNLQLEYLKEDGKTPMLDWADGISLQDALLMLIYRKTGVIFVKPSGYPHNIIPTTLRGLNQMLRMLADMKDIPLITRSDSFETSQKLAKAIREQVTIQEYNLLQFSDYFSNDWIHVKVTDWEDHNFLRELRNASGEMYVPMTVDYLSQKYDVGGKQVRNSVYLDSLMLDLQEKNSTQDGYYLLFAIRTLFSLKHHMMILAQKHDALSAFSDANSAPTVFVVDYNPEKLHLSKTYLVNPNLLDLSLGEAVSIKNATIEKESYENGLKELTEKWNSAKDKCTIAANKRNDAHQRLSNAKVDRQLAEQSLREAKNNKNVAKAELNSIEGTDYLGTAQERVLVLNAKKAVARTEIGYVEALEHVEKLNTQSVNIEAEVREADKEYQKCEQELKHLRSELDNMERNPEVYQKALWVYQGEHSEPESMLVRPAFVVRNALHDAWKAKGNGQTADIQPGRHEVKQLLHDCMVSEDKNGFSYVNFMNLITFLLRLGAKELDSLKNSYVSEDTQRMLYYAQECALAIAANWEVQDQLYKKIRVDFSKTKEEFSHDSYFGTLPEGKISTVKFDTLFEAIDKVLQRSLNDGSVFSYFMDGCGGMENKRGVLASNGYWSIYSGYRLLFNRHLFDMDFENTMREIFDLPAVRFDLPDPNNIIKDKPDRTESTIHPEDLIEGL